MRLAFVAHVLSEERGRYSQYGILVPFHGAPQRIRLLPLHPEIKAIIESLRAWRAHLPPDPPPLVLNRHCVTCPFHAMCLEEATKQGHLSLLNRMTPKVMEKYRRQGILTIEQLSYAYRPRRRRKRRANAPTGFRFELQALALRMGKIYLHEKPTLPKHPVELFLDIEGLPDEEVDYLIGLDIREGDRVVRHSFWADAADDEAGIFSQCLKVAAQYRDAPIFHYGSYEPRALARVAKKHGIRAQGVVERLVNVNSAVFGKVYFPARSNRLKDLGPLIGIKWDHPDASGLESVAWRWQWECTHDNKYKDLLLDYNHTDCLALRCLVDRLRALSGNGTCSDSDCVDAGGTQATATGHIIHRAFGDILKSAYEEYKGKRILIGETLAEAAATQGHPVAHTRRGLHHRRSVAKVNKVFRVARKRTCPYDGSKLSYSTRRAERCITEIEFGKHGCRRVVHRYVGHLACCLQCKRVYNPPAISRFKKRFFGDHLQAWIGYLRIVLRLPYRAISQMLAEVFGEYIGGGMHGAIIERLARIYSGTERALLEEIRRSPFAHVDETQVNICGANQYVWVLTNGSAVVFRLTETRETTLIRNLLSGFEGVLISDFYGGYDSVPCRQQKCFGHLIRDLNEDLWRNPYNVELEAFVGQLKEVVVPIFQSANRFGLKAYHLRRFTRSVDRFYDRHVVACRYSCDITEKYRKRFVRYRESLFRFLVEDGIPWNNNTAERAIRHLAVQRKISGSFGEGPMHQYLRLLGIAQTCRFQGKSFLKFLLSGEKDVRKFKQPRARLTSP